MIRHARQLQKHLSRRPDTEHEQAIVRLIIAALILGYLSILEFGGGHQEWLYQSMLVILGETVLAIALVVSVCIDDKVSAPRRLIGMVGDYVTVGAMMTLGGSSLAPLYVIYLWVTIGNGLRYGQQYLVASTGIAAASFLLVIQYSSYWQGNAPLAWGLLLGIVAIPVYLMKLLKALTSARDEARRADAAKTRFLATMSHEFRTPLNGIVSASELLSVTDLNSEQRESAEILQASAKSLLGLVEDVLDIARIEAGKVRQRVDDFSLAGLLRSVELVLRPLADKRRLAFTVDIDRDIPDRLHGDEDHLRQIIMNLASNALKFTEEGSVRIAVSGIGETRGDSVLVHIAVKDTGIGIPQSAQARIFEAFEQVDQGHSRRYSGSGLGTTIAKSLTELLGGTIGFESTEGQGSHFWLTLRLQIAADQQSRDVESPVVADRASSGSDSLVAQADVADKSGLPTTSGRVRPRLVASVGNPANVVAIDDPFFRHRSLGLGAMKILIADDQPTNLAILCRLLEKAGHRFHQVSSGDEVLGALEHSQYDCVIVDLHMPGCSGVDTIRQARVMESGGRRTPFIVLTADVTAEAVRECEVAGARAFLTKPIVASKLLEVLGDVARENADERRSVLEVARGGSAISLLNNDALTELAKLGLGDDFLRLFITECHVDATRCLNNMEKLFTACNWEGVREQCHALKGVAMNMAALRLVTDVSTMMNLDSTQLAREGRQRIKSLQWCLESTRMALLQSIGGTPEAPLAGSAG